MHYTNKKHNETQTLGEKKREREGEKKKQSNNNKQGKQNSAEQWATVYNSHGTDMTSEPGEAVNIW